MPSQLYKHLQQTYGAFRTESFIRTLWIKQMPIEVQVILAAFPDKGIEEITAVADSVMRVVDTNSKKNEMAYRDLLLLQKFDMLSNKVERLASDVRCLLKWEAGKRKRLGVGELNCNDVVMPSASEKFLIRAQRSAVRSPNPEGCRIRSQKSKGMLNVPIPSNFRQRSKIRARSASPSSRLTLSALNSQKKESLASFNTYNVQIPRFKMNVKDKLMYA